MSPRQDQIDEWCDAEVTQYLLTLLQRRLDETFTARAETFYPGEPQRTQEQKAMLLGAESELRDIIDSLQSKSLQEYEDQGNEQIGHSPERRQGFNQTG